MTTLLSLPEEFKNSRPKIFDKNRLKYRKALRQIRDRLHGFVLFNWRNLSEKPDLFKREIFISYSDFNMFISAFHHDPGYSGEYF